MEFMELLETVRHDEASTARLFADAGHRVRGRKDPRYLANLAEAASLVADVFEGRRPVHRLQEAMSTSDFPILFGDILDRQLLANYREWPVIWPSIARRASVRDFRTVKRFYVDGGEDILPAVNEQEEYTSGSLDEGKYEYSVAKYGKKFPFSWETMINDDLDALKDIPARMARSARRSESKFVTELYVGTTGPHTSLYTSGNKNIVNTTNGAASTNPVLSVAGLQGAMIVLGSMVDADGEPIVMETVTLVVPPALEVTAQNIANAIQLELAEAGGTSNQKLIAQNWMRNRLQIVVDPYIPIVASSSNGNTSWFLFGNPSTGRPALEIGFLRGHEDPEIFMKEPNARRVGGNSDPMNGDFDTDSIEYKIRHVFGGTRMSPKATVASNGSGS